MDHEGNPADQVDRACLEQERFLEESIRAAKAKAAPALPYKGTCYNCDEPLQEADRFCDEFCRDDHEKRERSRTVNGMRV